MAENGLPGPERDDWIDFLRWCESDWFGSHSSGSVVDVVEKPWQYADVYADYLREGGVGRGR